VDNPATGNLKSVFILRNTEKKLVDERAKKALAVKFEYKFRTKPDGSTTVPEGFLKFELVEGTEEVMAKAAESFQVSGNDIEYFQEDTKVDSSVTPMETPEEVAPEMEGGKEFVCDKCGKEFASKRALQGHKISHKKK